MHRWRLRGLKGENVKGGEHRFKLLQEPRGTLLCGSVTQFPGDNDAGANARMLEVPSPSPLIPVAKP
jgi:hypothetical protein